jgi:hypothetical protein
MLVVVVEAVTLQHRINQQVVLVVVEQVHLVLQQMLLLVQLTLEAVAAVAAAVKQKLEQLVVQELLSFVTQNRRLLWHIMQK